jgi:hypothetical protein
MTPQERIVAQQSESGLAARGTKDQTEKKKADSAEGMRHFAKSAGNSAMTQMLTNSQGGTPLRNDFREQMERRLGVSLASVRIRDDAAAHESAAAMDAEAYTAGEQIVMGNSAPSVGEPGGEEFLAHELVHVVQQRNASEIQPHVNARGDQFESEAETLAKQASMGQSLNVNARGAVPTVQRQPTGTLRMRAENPNASRTEVEQAILAYLQRAQAAQEENKLRLTDPVKTALRMLASTNAPGTGAAGDMGKAQRTISMDSLINGATTDAADLAKRASQILPDPFDRAALKKLETMAVADAPKGFIDRAKESAEKNLKTPDMPDKDLLPDPKKKMDEEMDKMRAARGGPQGHGFGPVAVDPFAVARVIGDLRKKPKKPSVQARDYPAVEQAIQKIAPGALMPPEAKGKSNEGEFVEQAQDVARDLAAKLDIAQQKNEDTVELRLPPAYHHSQSRDAMISAVESIVQAIRQALPHHASNVKCVDLYFGDFRAKRITTGPGD